MIGLSRSDSDASYASIDYAMYLVNDGGLQVYEKGVLRDPDGTTCIGTYRHRRRAAGGAPRRRDGRYEKNGEELYRSGVASTGTLRVDTAFYSPGATLQDVVLSSNGGAAAPVAWTNPTGVSMGQLAPDLTTSLADVDGDGRADAVLAAADGRLWVRRGQADGSLGAASAQGAGATGLNRLRKTTGVAMSGNSGASSAQAIAGAGWVESRVADADADRMIGLSYADTGASQLALDYAIYLAANGTLSVREDDVPSRPAALLRRGRHDPHRAPGRRHRRLRAERRGLLHQRDGVHRRPAGRHLALFAGATLRRAMISVDGGSATEVQWVESTSASRSTAWRRT